MTLIEIFSIIIIHWFADFVLQTDWQAKNKSSNNKALTSHVMSYSAVWLFVCSAYSIITHNWYMISFPTVTFTCHWVTDYFTSRLNTKLWKEQKVHYFFVSVGFDQVLHYIQLFLTYELIK